MSVLCILLLLVAALCQNPNSTCDFSMQILKNDLSSFYGDAYNPPRVNKFYDRLYNLYGSILAGWQICDNHIDINPEGHYTRNTSNCILGMDSVANLSILYANQTFVQIRAGLNHIADVVFQAGTNCREVIGYKGWSNISDSCKIGIQSHEELISKYENDIILGGNGTKYLNDLLLKFQQQRKLCDFQMLAKASLLPKDSCRRANQQWLYPIIDVFDSAILKQNYLNYTGYFYMAYQSVSRAQSLCVNGISNLISVE